MEGNNTHWHVVFAALLLLHMINAVSSVSAMQCFVFCSFEENWFRSPLEAQSWLLFYINNGSNDCVMWMEFPTVMNPQRIDPILQFPSALLSFLVSFCLLLRFNSPQLLFALNPTAFISCVPDDSRHLFSKKSSVHYLLSNKQQAEKVTTVNIEEHIILMPRFHWHICTEASQLQIHQFWNLPWVCSKNWAFQVDSGDAIWQFASLANGLFPWIQLLIWIVKWVCIVTKN